MPTEVGGGTSGRRRVGGPTLRRDGPTQRRGRARLLAAVVVVVGVVAIGVVVTLALDAGPGRVGRTEQGTGGSWTDVTADELAAMLVHKDFTFIDVKTPYVGEIAGTDLWIPYDQLASRVAELPADRGAKVLVYCRSGAESRVAAQTLLDLGYRNVWNLDGGMQAWQASGRQIIQKPRS